MPAMTGRSTPTAPHRRWVGTSSVRRILDAVLAAFLTLCVAAASAGETGRWHSIDDIRATAEAAAKGSLRHDGRLVVTADPLDPRLKLAACGGPLSGEPHGSRRPHGATTVKVRCPGPSPWKVYVKVSLKAWTEAVVAARPLGRGHAIGAGDVRIEERELGAMSHGYLTAVDQAIGQTVRRPVQAGDVLTPRHVAAPLAVERGQQVTLLAASGPVQVRVEGLALADGAVGQRIPVRNMSSRRDLEGIVRSPKVVEILLN